MIWVYPIKKEEEDKEFTYEDIMRLEMDDRMYYFENEYDPKLFMEYELLYTNPIKNKQYVGFIVFDVINGLIKRTKLKYEIVEYDVKNLFNVEAFSLNEKTE